MKCKGAKKIVKRITPPLKVVNELVFYCVFLAVAAIDCLLCKHTKKTETLSHLRFSFMSCFLLA